MTIDRRRLRETFDEVPELYDLSRPRYPDELFDDLLTLARVPTGGRVLEIGPGTGQATLPLAERGLDVVAVELGPGLAAVTRRKLARFTNVDVVVSAFETWDPKDARFDLVCAFTAFHWIDPEVRYVKSASVLREGGALAVVSSRHVLPDDGDSFWVEVQEDYDAVVPGEENGPPPRPDDVPDLHGEIDASGRFRTIASRRYVWDVVYSANEYVAVLNTYSNHRVVAEDVRLELYGRTRRRIESRPDPRVRKTYLATLDVAERV